MTGITVNNLPGRTVKSKCHWLRQDLKLNLIAKLQKRKKNFQHKGCQNHRAEIKCTGHMYYVKFCGENKYFNFALTNL